MPKPIKVVKDSRYNNMFRLQWKDKVLSQYMYNLTRANDILRRYKFYERNVAMQDIRGERVPRRLTDAFK